MDSLFCGKATAVAAVPRTVAKSRLSNPQKSKKTSFRLSNCWQQTQFSIRVALGCKVALKCNPRSVCNRPTNWNLSVLQLLNLIGNHSHILCVCINYNGIQCLIHRYSCYASLNYIFRANTSFYIH